MNENITIALADDHVILRDALAQLLEKEGFTILFQSSNGQEMLNSLRDLKPDIILMDIDMPIMNGYETTLEIRKSNPNIKILTLTVSDDDISVVKMMKAGANGYLLKDISIEEMKKSLVEVFQFGMNYSDFLRDHFYKAATGFTKIRGLHNKDLKDREIEFVKLCCSEMTYKDISMVMNLSIKTIDGYRERTFEKTGVKNRIGLVMYALNNGYVKLNK